jgi:hypothetical protein
MGNGGPAFNPAWRSQLPPEYADAIVQRIGEERAARALGMGWRMQLFPNAAFAANQIRVIRPISVDKTEILQYHVIPDGFTDAQRIAAIRGHQNFYGPAGYGSPDDIELFARMFEGYRTSALKSLNQEALFSRGMTRETRGPNGERFGHTSSEVEQRAIYYAWTALMKGESHVTITDADSGIPTAQAALSEGGGKSGGGVEV